MLIDVRSLSFAYDRIPVLQDVSFQTEEGSLVAVLGPNGVGKSTLFKCLLGFLKKYTGEILLGGIDSRTMSQREMSKMIAYIPQSSEPVFNYTLQDIVLMGTTAGMGTFSRPKEAQVEEARAALDDLGILHLADRGIGRVSGGERQLTLIARAIVQKARILIMDEPTANLDYGNKFRVMNKIKELSKQGYTILLSTHDPEQALRFSSHVLALSGGRVCAYGNTDEVLTEELLKKLYNISVTTVVGMSGDVPVKTFIQEE